MALFELPVINNLTSFDQEVELGGNIFTLHFYYSFRADAWYLDVFRDIDTPIVYGIRIFSGIPLNIPYSDLAVIRGTLFTIDLEETNEDPRGDLWRTRFRIYYDERTG